MDYGIQNLEPAAKINVHGAAPGTFYVAKGFKGKTKT